MKIGFPNNPRSNILSELEWIGKNQFDFVDLFLEEDQAVPERIDIEKTKGLLRRYNLGVVGHTGWYLPIGSPVRTLRDAAIRETERYFKIFAQLQVEYVTIHANWPPSLFSKQEGIKLQVGTLRKLARVAKDYNLGLLYEPIDTRKDDLKAVAQILKRVPDLFLQIDIGHAALHGNKPEQFIEKFHQKLKHVHLHDNDGYSDLHLPLGAGKIGWRNIVRNLKKYYDGTITLEIFSEDRDYVLLSRDKLRKLWYE